MNIGQLLIQLFFIVIVVGGIYSLWQATSAYGGLIGAGLRWIGVGILFFSVEALDRVLGNLSLVSSLSGDSARAVHDGILLLGLVFSFVGFAKLRQVTKQK